MELTDIGVVASVLTDVASAPKQGDEGAPDAWLVFEPAVADALDGIQPGDDLIGVPTLLLRTTGRRSGAARTNALVYARDGDDYLVVASNGGADRPPAWLYNLQADSNVGIQVGRERRTARARVVEPSDPDYAR